MIDVLKRIDDLKKLKKWSEYQLAESSGLTQSTISSWYRKNLLPTLSSLDQVCDAFDISMAQFFIEDNERMVVINEQQKELLDVVAKMSNEQREILIEFLRVM